MGPIGAQLVPNAPQTAALAPKRMLVGAWICMKWHQSGLMEPIGA
jgi:hypothetical protein